jgi:two-component system, OmpR family, sensor kinase
MRSFRHALALRTAGSVLALMLLVGAVSALALRALLYRQLDDTLVHLAEVEAQAGAAHTGSAFEFHEGVLLAASPGPSAELTRYAELWSSEGAPLIRSRNLPADLMLPANAVAAAREGRIVWDTHVWRGEQIRCVVYPLRLVGPAHGMHMLQVAAPLAPLERTLRDFVLLILLLLLLTTGAAFLVGWRIAGIALRPTTDITEQAEAIREGTPNPTITAHADADEFARLVRVLNGMLDRLDRASAVQRRFTADASHELRGPLTALRGDLDLALKRERSPAEYRETLERCREEVIRLTRIATDLLTLARNEAGLDPQEQTEVDLRQVADRVIARFQSAVAERGLRFALEGPTAIVRGDPAMLQRVVGNLVDNAVKHSPAGGTITIVVHSGESVELIIRDQGPGVPQEDQAQLFNRFFRGGTQPRGSVSTGLGLAIAKAAADAHGGRLEFVRNDPGAVFRLVLPLTTS